MFFCPVATKTEKKMYGAYRDKKRVESERKRESFGTQKKSVETPKRKNSQSINQSETQNKKKSHTKHNKKKSKQNKKRRKVEKQLWDTDVITTTKKMRVRMRVERAWGAGSGTCAGRQGGGGRRPCRRGT